MQPRRLAVRASLALGVLALAGGAGPAAAQNWDWGGGNTVGGSGREVVSFNASFKPGQIIASFSDRRLYLITSPGQAFSYPIAIPREQSRWQGVMHISEKRVNPSWTPTPTMRAENPRLPSWVPGGHPMNPLGVRGLYLGSSAYRIHGTDAPWTIGQPVSKGCIRMYNQDVIDLYDRVAVGARVTVTWQSFGGARTVVASAAEERPPVHASRPARRVNAPSYQSESILGSSSASGWDDESAPAPAPRRRTSVKVKSYVPASTETTSSGSSEAPAKATSRSRPQRRAVTPQQPADDALPYTVDEERPAPPRRRTPRVRSVSVEE